MPEKDPTNYGWLTYAWVILLAVAGGVVSFSRKMRDGVVRAFNLTEFLGEIFTSGVVGVLTFFLCEWSGVPPLLSAVFIAVSGHMGSRVMFGLEKMFERWLLGRSR